MNFRSIIIALLYLNEMAGPLAAQPAAPFARYLGAPGNYPPEYRLQQGASGYWLLHNFVDSTLFVPQLSKVNSDGSLRWSRDLSLSGIVSPRARLLSADANGLVLAGTLQQSGYKTFLARLDSTGNVQSNTTIDLGAYNEPVYVGRRGGSTLMAGYRDYPDSTGHYSFDMTLVRLDSNNQVMRASATGNDTMDFTLATAVMLRNGSLVTAGEAGTRALARFTCQLAWWTPRDSLFRLLRVDDGSYFTRLRPVTAALSGDSAIYLAAVGSTTASNEHELVLIKIDTAGQLRWSKRYYQIAYDLEARALTLDPAGRVCLVGNCYRSVSDNGTFLLRLDSDGVVLDGKIFRAPVFTFGGNATTDLLADADGTWTYPVYYYYNNLYTPALVHTDSNLMSPCVDLDDAFVFATAGTNFQLLPSPLPDQEFLSIASDTLGCSVNNRSSNEGDLCLAVGLETVAPEQADALSIFPNPAEGQVWLKGLKGKTTLRLYDLSGKEVLSLDLPGPEDVQLLRLQGLAAGVYSLSVEDTKGIRSGMILLGE